MGNESGGIYRSIKYLGRDCRLKCSIQQRSPSTFLPHKSYVGRLCLVQHRENGERKLRDLEDSQYRCRKSGAILYSTGEERIQEYGDEKG